MSKPTASDVHVNAPLTNISVAYIQSQDVYIADKVFPPVPVEKQSDLYFTYDKGDFFRDEVKERAPATESEGGGYSIDVTSNYYARLYALHKDIDDQLRANADAPLNPDRDATEFLTQLHLIRRDKVWAANYFTTGKWGLDLTGVAAAPGANQFLQWNLTTSTPAKDVRAQRTRIGIATGYWPNTLVLGVDTYDALAEHPDIIDRIKHTAKGVITPELLASVFDVPKVLIARATNNTAKEGVAASMSAISNSKSALLVYANPTPSLLQPSGGYSFIWKGMGGGSLGTRIKKFRMEHLSADRIEGEQAWDLKLVAADVGSFFTAAVL